MAWVPAMVRPMQRGNLHRAAAMMARRDEFIRLARRWQGQPIASNTIVGREWLISEPKLPFVVEAKLCAARCGLMQNQIASYHSRVTA